MSAIVEPTPPIGSTHTFVGPLMRASCVASEDTAIVCGSTRLTYAQLLQRARKLAGALRALGLQRGDRVAVVGHNCHRYLELYLAVPAAGLVLVPLNARHTEHELRYALADANARVLFTDDQRALLADAVEHWYSMGDGYEQVLLDAPEADWAAVHSSDLAGLFYTGGTTGAAKGVMLTHGNLVANALHFMACWPFTQNTTWLVVAPMFHAAGTIGVLATVWAGGRHVMLPAFDPAAVLDTIERERVTATLVVPTMMSALVAEQLARPRDVSSLAYLSHGSAPVAAEVLRRTCEAFPAASLLHIYGATETAPIVTLLPDEQDMIGTPRARSCGRPAVGVELQVIDGDGVPQPPMGIGEIRVRGHNVTAGYWGKPEETENALKDGWYATGDLGYLDEQGYLFLVDRAKDMIVTGGENVYSIEVEEALHRHVDVQEVAVFGIPHARWGEAVHAVVVTSAPITEEALVAHCRAFIAGYKLPKSIELRRDPLPKSGAGKILKRELREPHWRGQQTRVGGA
jgi:long-chain acyl-CoA synthetase